MQLTKMSTVDWSRRQLEWLSVTPRRRTIQQLLKRPPLGRLRHIPLDDILLLDANLPEQVDRTAPASPQRTNDQHLELADAALAQPIDLGLDVVDHELFALVRLQALENALPALLLLPDEGERAGSGARESRVEAERSDPPALVVLEELEIVQRAPATAETAEDVGPPALLLVAVRKGDVRVREGVPGGVAAEVIGRVGRRRAERERESQ